MTRLVLFELFVKTYYCLSINKKKLLELGQFSEPYGVTKLTRLWLKDGCRKPMLGV